MECSAGSTLRRIFKESISENFTLKSVRGFISRQKLFVASAVEMLQLSVFVKIFIESQLRRTGVDVVGLVVLIKLNHDNFHPAV